MAVFKGPGLLLGEGREGERKGKSGEEKL